MFGACVSAAIVIPTAIVGWITFFIVLFLSSSLIASALLGLMSGYLVYKYQYQTWTKK